MAGAVGVANVVAQIDLRLHLLATDFPELALELVTDVACGIWKLPGITIFVVGLEYGYRYAEDGWKLVVEGFGVGESIVLICYYAPNGHHHSSNSLMSSTRLERQRLLPGSTAGRLRRRAHPHHEGTTPPSTRPRQGLNHPHRLSGSDEETPGRRTRTRPGRSTRDHRVGPRAPRTGQHRLSKIGTGPPRDRWR